MFGFTFRFLRSHVGGAGRQRSLPLRAAEASRVEQLATVRGNELPDGLRGPHHVQPQPHDPTA